MQAPVSVAMSTTDVTPHFCCAYHSASASVSRPSASVLFTCKCSSGNADSQGLGFRFRVSFRVTPNHDGVWDSHVVNSILTEPRGNNTALTLTATKEKETVPQLGGARQKDSALIQQPDMRQEPASEDRAPPLSYWPLKSLVNSEPPGHRLNDSATTIAVIYKQHLQGPSSPLTFSATQQRCA